MSDSQEKAPKVKHYTEVPEYVKAVEMFKDIKDYMTGKYPEVNVVTAFLAVSLLEEAVARVIPRDALGELEILSTKVVAPELLTQVMKEEIAKEAEDDFKFNVPGNGEIH